MEEIADKDILTGLVNTDSFDLKSDSIHFNSKGQLELGKAFMKEYLRLVHIQENQEFKK